MTYNRNGSIYAVLDGRVGFYYTGNAKAVVMNNLTGQSKYPTDIQIEIKNNPQTVKYCDGTLDASSRNVFLDSIYFTTS
jgi:hypothetical protein